MHWQYQRVLYMSLSWCACPFGPPSAPLCLPPPFPAKDEGAKISKNVSLVKDAAGRSVQSAKISAVLLSRTEALLCPSMQEKESSTVDDRLEKADNKGTLHSKSATPTPLPRP